MKKFIILISLLSTFTYSIVNASEKTDSHQFTIGTGSMSGVYFHLGAEICDLFNEYNKINLKCNINNSEGSLANIEGLMNNKYQFGIVEAKILHEAYEKRNIKDKEHFGKLRTVLTLYPETYAVVVRKDSKINNIEDIKGKKVNIGKAGSGIRKAANNIFEIFGFNKYDFAELKEESIYHQGDRLCEGNIDVAIYVIGHPSAAIYETMDECEARFIPINGPKVKAYLENNRHFNQMQIPAMYAGNNSVTDTIGTKSILVATTDTNNQLVSEVVNIILNNLKKFKDSHPAFKDLSPFNMKPTITTVPIHDGSNIHKAEN